MASNSYLKRFLPYRDPKVCASEGLFVAEGVKIADEVLKENIRLRAVIATSEWLEHNRQRIASGVEIMEVPTTALERISAMRTPNQVWMLAERPSREDILRRHPQQAGCPLAAIATDRIQDPGNMGTILRLADWYGIRQVVCGTDSVSPFSPKVVQASMGSVLRVTTHNTDLKEYLTQCHNEGMAVYGAALGGDNIYHCKLQYPAVLLIGNESQGINPDLLKAVDHTVSIPNIGGTCESLNAAVATAIFCSEFYRSVTCEKFINQI